MKRPEIFKYHDYREYLKDWLAYGKASQSGFSMRTFAKQAGLATGYLPMVLGGSRHLSEKALAKVLLVMDLSPAEQKFFRSLVTLGTSDSQDVRLAALAEMRSSKHYQRSNPRESEVHRYLTHWYYVAIREMAALPDFKFEAEWIRSRLKGDVSLGEIRKAMEFLKANGFIEIGQDGKVSPPNKTLDCLGGVYRLALTQFHKEMFELAGQSIDNTPSEQRQILGHTFSVDAKNFEGAQQILKEAFEKIRALQSSKKEEGEVYHIGMALFPVTQKGKKS